jgi:hypothetical protein
MKMAAAFIEAFGIGVAIAVGSRLFRIRIANPDTDSDTDCYGLSLFSEQMHVSHNTIQETSYATLEQTL